MIDITYGNRWTLTIALTQDGSAMSISSMTGIHVRLISETVVNYPHDLTEDVTLADNVMTKAMAANELPVGMYGVEVYKDDDWRAFGKSMIRITDMTTHGGASAAAVGGDSYDVVMTANGIVANISMAVGAEQSGGGTSGQVQADWEQTDQTAPDYIKHKPTIPDTSTFVPTSRKVNGKALTSDITLDASDVGALPDSTPIPSLEGYATQTWVGQQGFLTQHQDISGKEDKVGIATTLPATLEAGKYYRLGSVSTLSAALPTVSDTEHAASIIIGLTASADITPQLTSSASVYYQEGFEIKSGGMYEINCLWNGNYWCVTSIKFETA